MNLYMRELILILTKHRGNYLLILRVHHLITFKCSGKLATSCWDQASARSALQLVYKEFLRGDIFRPTGIKASVGKFLWEHFSGNQGLLQADYWIIDVKDYWTINRENLGTRLCHSTKREMAASRGYKFEQRKYFEWIIKQLLNSVGFLGGCYQPRFGLSG